MGAQCPYVRSLFRAARIRLIWVSTTLLASPLKTLLLGGFGPLSDTQLPADFTCLSKNPNAVELENTIVCGLGYQYGLSCRSYGSVGNQSQIIFRQISDHCDSSGPVFSIHINTYCFPLGLGSAGSDYDATRSLVQLIDGKWYRITWR